MVKNLSHTLAYSLIGLQELNLAYKYPLILWNCACLITDSGGTEKEEEEEENTNIIEEFESDNIGIFEEEEEEEVEEDEEVNEVVKKKSSKTVNYGKIATAIGKMKHEGITIVATDINRSKYTFTPDVDKNLIIYGLSGITRVGDDLIKEIISKRPYNSIEDFLNKVKVNKPQMINLIKSGAFDSLYNNDRVEAMKIYIDLIADKKKRITLQNMKMLIDFHLIPQDYEFQCRVFNFNKYLKKTKINDSYGLDLTAFTFYSNNFDIDYLTPYNKDGILFLIKQTKWDNLYKKQMDIIRPFIQKHNAELLEKVNQELYNETWNKYCLGTISKWEMDSISCYIHDHEMSQVKNIIYGFSDFSKLSEEPTVNYEFTSKQTGQKIPLYKIYRIAGTVLDKDKNKKTVTLLTTDSVVTVKIFGDAFTHYDKQLSERGVDGKKHVTEKSMLTRGNKIIVTGIRKEENFICKKYKSTPYPLVEQITNVDESGYIKTYARQSS